MSPIDSFIALALFSSSALAAIGPVADLVVYNADVSPDGFTRSAVTVGGGAVGTLITGNIGDNFQLNVVDQLNDTTMLTDTTIHWHGLFQNGSGWADGPAFVNQCPILSGNSFLYDFDVPNQAGTFWYHSHLQTQYCDGLRGPLVVYDPSDPYADLYDVDDDTTVWSLSDWYHDVAPTLVLPTADSNLLNGLGRWALGGVATDLTIISVTQGSRYRIRLINLSCDPNYVVTIDNHTMTVIEVDGVNHVAIATDAIQIFAGQRYSFILEANQTVGNYWIHFNPDNGVTGFSGGINSALLRYVGAEDEEPADSTPVITNQLAESSLVPLENPGAPGVAGVGNADVNINLAVAFTAAGDFTVNGLTWTSPSVPVLLQILSGAQAADDLLPQDSIYRIEQGQTVEVSIPGNVAGNPHPIHLHGHTFDVVRSAGETTYNYDNPPRRDVVSLGTATTDNVTIRFLADNPGPWFLHCHIDWHLELGFAITFAETPEVWNTSIVPTTDWDDLCTVYDASLD